MFKMPKIPKASDDLVEPPVAPRLKTERSKSPERDPNVEKPGFARVPTRHGTPGVTHHAKEKPNADGPLTGTWRGDGTFHIDDDGKTLTIRLIDSGTIKDLTGQLTRHADKATPDADKHDSTFEGTLKIAFLPSSRRYGMHATATQHGADRLTIRCADWPVIDKNGRRIGDKVFKGDLKRSPE